MGAVITVQRPGPPATEQPFRQPVIPPAVSSSSFIQPDGRTFGALVPVTTAQDFLQVLGFCCMVLGGEGLLREPTVERRLRCRAALVAACGQGSPADRQYYRSLLSTLEASTGGELPPEIAEDRLCQEVVATFNRQARAVVAAVVIHAQRTPLWGPAKLAARRAMEAGSSAAAGAPATELYEL